MTENALIIRGLSKVYKNKLLALDNIDLNVKMGDFFADFDLSSKQECWQS